MFKILNTLAVIMSPVLTFTSEEIYQSIKNNKKLKSVQLEDWPKLKKELSDDAEGVWSESDWDIILSVRKELFLAIEKMRDQKLIKQSQEADVILFLEEPLYEMFRVNEEFIREIFMVASLKIESPDTAVPENTFVPQDYPKIKIFIKKTDLPKCPRCWNFVKGFSKNEKYTDICDRCANAVESINK